MSKQNVLLKKLIISQMVIEGVSMATIDFFKNAFGILSSENGVGCPRMAEEAFVTRQNANLHCRRLQEAGYLERCNYRAWRLAEKPVRDTDLLTVMNAMSVSLPFYHNQISPAFVTKKAAPKMHRAAIIAPPRIELVLF